MNKNKNGSCIKLNKEVHSRNHYNLTIYLEMKKKKTIKTKNRSSYKKPQYIYELLGNKIKKEIE